MAGKIDHQAVRIQLDQVEESGLVEGWAIDFLRRLVEEDRGNPRVRGETVSGYRMVEIQAHLDFAITHGRVIVICPVCRERRPAPQVEIIDGPPMRVEAGVIPTVMLNQINLTYSWAEQAPAIYAGRCSQCQTYLMG